MGPALERMILVVTLMVWVWFEGHTQLFICCLKLAPVTRGTKPCQTHEWAFGASIRSFFLNSLGEKQDPSPFIIIFYLHPAFSWHQWHGLNPARPTNGHLVPSEGIPHFYNFCIFFVFFVFFVFFLRFLCFHHTSNTPRAPPAQWKPLPTSINWQPWHG